MSRERDEEYIDIKWRLEMQLNEATSKLEEMVRNWSEELIEKHRDLVDQKEKMEQAYTELEKKEQKLTESEQKYRVIVESAGDAIITLDSNNTVLSWNEGATDIFGYTNAEAVGRNIDELLIKDDVREEALNLTRKAHGGEKIQSYESVRYAKDGMPKHVLITATPLEDNGGGVYGISLIYKDVSQLKAAQQQLVQAEKQAALGLMAGSIGHELNNAVGEILIYTDLLRKHPDDSSHILETVDVISGIIEKISIHGRNLLSLSKPETPEMRSQSIQPVLEKVTQTMVICGILKYFKIVQKFSPDLPRVLGDVNLLEQVIRNLEINAAHAMGEEGTLTIGTSLSRDGNSVEFFISDTGTGISAETQEKIFQPFFTTKADGKGTGLGLAIVKQIIEQHLGYIDIKSKMGTGTTVTIGIPKIKEQK